MMGAYSKRFNNGELYNVNVRLKVNYSIEINHVAPITDTPLLKKQLK